jgi:hypothetical protein
MRVRKQLPVPAADGDPDWDRIWCNWETCDNPASGLHRLVICHAARRHARAQMCQYCEIKTFCSEGHKDYQARSHIPEQYGKLAPGTNRRFL